MALPGSLPDFCICQTLSWCNIVGTGRNLSTSDSWEDNGALDPLKKSVDCLLPELPRERLPSRIRCSLRPFNCCSFTFDLTALWQSATACPFSPLILLCCWESWIPNGGGKTGLKRRKSRAGERNWPHQGTVLAGWLHVPHPGHLHRVDSETHFLSFTSLALLFHFRVQV